ncbi:TSC22 domain family protein 4 isoform X2 [Microtus ochrogaster]|uniref:TSC22 domain family protein 4 isoform X2 n=1 Tax=Microtus ochrogaster TaxID=79684 RepID=A0ABM0LRS9_MICOH|nr:TSC22 domain family protein 4 isoform X2 [Microtus ochrogaster]
MSGGKKKSSFQITSVTTDYEGPGSPGASDPPAPPAPAGPPPRLPNGEPNPDPGGRGTPRNGSPPPGAPASRFRVVKLPQGLGEPYRRGRWTCVDVYERDLEPPSFGRLLEGIRGASGGTGGRSLDSRLELASLGISTPIPQPGLSQGPTSWLRPPPTSPGPQARSFTGGLGQLAGPGKAKVETPPLSASPPQQRPPGSGTGDGSQPQPSLRGEVESGGSAAGTPPLSRRRDGAVRLRMELVGPEEMGKVPPIDSRPNSPALYFDASLVHKSPDPFGAAAAQSLSLARSMLVISGHLDSDDDSGSGSLVGIDNKIEQAMVQFWKYKTKPSMPDQPKKPSLKEKTALDFDPSKMVKPHKEPKVSDLDVCPGVLEPSVLAAVKDMPAVPRKSRSLMQLSRNVVHSVSTLMVSALQSGWRLCKWKSSMNSASISSRMKSRSALETPEAEMLREVYLVLWVIRKQLRELARRQERHRRRRMRSHASHTSHHSDPVQGLKQDAQSPL